MSVGPQNPTARVEYALRADEALSEPQVRQIMEYYLAVRVRRFARTFSSASAPEQSHGSNGSTSSAGSVYGRTPMDGGIRHPIRLPEPGTAPRYGAVRPAVRPPTRTPGRP